MGGFLNPVVTDPVITDNWGGQQPKRPGLFSRLLNVATGQQQPRPMDERPPLSQTPPLHHLDDDQQTRNSPPSTRPDPYAPLMERMKAMQGEYDKLNAPPPPLSTGQKIGRLASLIAPVAIGAAGGGLTGAGAAAGGQARGLQIDRQRQLQEQAQRDAQKRSLLQSIMGGEETVARGREAEAMREASQTPEQQFIKDQLAQGKTLAEALQAYAQITSKPAASEESKTVTVGDKVMQFNPQTKRYDIEVGSAKVGKPNDFEQFYADWLKDNGLTDSAHNRLQARSAFAQAGQPPQRDPQQLAITPDGTVIALRPGGKVPQGTKTASQFDKGPSADEQRRADLARNMSENLDQLEDILKRRPDLFGPYAGRMTRLKGIVGTKDEDIGKLNAIREYLGMASVGAHAMRNAQHVGAAADAVMAGFHNSPAATKAAIDAARHSIATFQQDVDRAQGGIQGGGQTGGAKLKDRVSGRVLVEGKDF